MAGWSGLIGGLVPATPYSGARVVFVHWLSLGRTLDTPMVTGARSFAKDLPIVEATRTVAGGDVKGMAGLDHGPAEQEPDDPATSARNARIGMRLFLGYLLVYLSYVVLVAFRPDWMRLTPWRGVNLAVAYGLTLIIAAFLLSLVYGWMCRRPVAPLTDDSPATTTGGRHEV